MQFHEMIVSGIGKLPPRYIRFGFVKELDLLGSAVDNTNKYAPAVKVIVVETSDLWLSDWLPILSPKCDEGGVEYTPPDVGAQVVLLCPDGSPEQMIIAGFLEGVPIEAGTTEETRSNLKVMAFGSSRARRVTVTVDRTEGDESYTIRTPNGHTVILKDKSGAQGIVVQTAEGHYVILRDDESENRVYVHHSGGTEIVFDEDGDMHVAVKRDKTEQIEGDRTNTIGGNSSETIDGDDSKDVGGALFYDVDGNVTISSKQVAKLHGDIMAALETALGMLSGIQAQLTHPTCYLTGAPIGSSTTAKASP